MNKNTIQTKECIGYRVKHHSSDRYVDVRYCTSENRTVHYLTDNEPAAISQNDAYVRLIRMIDEKTGVKSADLTLERVFRENTSQEITAKALVALVETLGQHCGRHLDTSKEEVESRITEGVKKFNTDELIERILKIAEG